MKDTNEIKWSIQTRIIHWVIALIVLFNMFIIEEGDPPHRYVGYVAFGLVGCRFILGFLGRHHERFVNFPIGFKNISLFLKTHFNRSHQFPGHNPLASIVYFLIWILILALGVTGWMMGLDKYFGEEWLENLHGNISNGLMGLVIIHLVGMLLDSFLYRRKTWLVMINGKKAP